MAMAGNNALEIEEILQMKLEITKLKDQVGRITEFLNERFGKGIDFSEEINNKDRSPFPQAPAVLESVESIPGADVEPAPVVLQSTKSVSVITPDLETMDPGPIIAEPGNTSPDRVDNTDYSGPGFIISDIRSLNAAQNDIGLPAGASGPEVLIIAGSDEENDDNSLSSIDSEIDVSFTGISRKDPSKGCGPGNGSTSSAPEIDPLDGCVPGNTGSAPEIDPADFGSETAASDNEENHRPLFPKNRIYQSTSSRLHKCDWPSCNKVFDRPYLLADHLNRHKGDVRPYKCVWSNCRKEYCTIKSLKRHERQVHKQTGKYFECKFKKCGRLFPNPNLLAEHVKTCDYRVRDAEDPLTCPDCNKNFNTVIGITQHKGICQSLRRGQGFVCAQLFCSEEFTHLSDLLKHEREKHDFHHENGDKLFKCDKCNASYTQQDKLNKHLANNHQKRKAKVKLPLFPFSCEICGSGFLEKWKLDKHLAENHGINESFGHGNEENDNAETHSETMYDAVSEISEEEMLSDHELGNIEDHDEEEMVNEINDINSYAKDKVNDIQEEEIGDVNNIGDLEEEGMIDEIDQYYAQEPQEMSMTYSDFRRTRGPNPLSSWMCTQDYMRI